MIDHLFPIQAVWNDHYVDIGPVDDIQCFSSLHINPFLKMDKADADELAKFIVDAANKKMASMFHQKTLAYLKSTKPRKGK